MTASLKGKEATIGQGCIEFAGNLERVEPIIVGVNHQRGRADRREIVSRRRIDRRRLVANPGKARRASGKGLIGL
ncbi:MAG: hypothetical protein V2I27_11880 [Erythrobacter sp.]|nr:hypothetical protein [Erythrobacter sp.]